MHSSFEYLVGAILFIYTRIKRFGLVLCPTSYIENVVKKQFQTLGITINGSQPWDIQVLKPQFYTEVAMDPSLGLGEGYMNQLWTVKDLRMLCNKVLNTQKNLKRTAHERSISKFRRYFKELRFQLLNLQSQVKSWEVGEKHYDLGNDLYENMLDKNMNYSCAYWKSATNLEDAQIAKMDLIAAKLMLKPGMKVLDIGCGFGTLARHMASKYGVTVVGVTISKEQAEYGRRICSGLPVTIELQDYRDLNYSGEFDRAVSVGMFEHVGVKNYKQYFQVIRNYLRDDGLFLLHTIGLNNTVIKRTDPWLDKYIFPNGTLPYHTEITNHTDGLFIIEDWHNMGFNYSKTLDAWDSNFDKSWSKFENQYGDRFYRMFKYYLITCSECFKARKLQLWQVVLSKKGYEGGYESIR